MKMHQLWNHDLRTFTDIIADERRKEMRADMRHDMIEVWHEDCIYDIRRELIYLLAEIGLRNVNNYFSAIARKKFSEKL